MRFGVGDVEQDKQWPRKGLFMACTCLCAHSTCLHSYAKEMETRVSQNIRDVFNQRGHFETSFCGYLLVADELRIVNLWRPRPRTRNHRGANKMSPLHLSAITKRYGQPKFSNAPKIQKPPLYMIQSSINCRPVSKPAIPVYS